MRLNCNCSVALPRDTALQLARNVSVAMRGRLYGHRSNRPACLRRLAL